VADDDGLDIPDFLKLPPERRGKGKVFTVPAKTSALAPRYASPEAEEIAAEQKKQKTKARIDKMLARRVPPIDHSKMRWCPRTNRFVPS